MKRTWIFAAAAFAACQQSSASQPEATIARSPLTVGSTIHKIRIVLASRLPPNPERMPLEDYCSAYARPHPKTPGGRMAAANGWIVTSETRLGSYDAVTFVGALDPATSATCAHVRGNLAIFDGRNLKALAYERRPSKDQTSDSSLGVDVAAEDSLGSAEQINQRRIRLYDGLPGPPFADVVLSNGISVERIARQDPVCGGAAFVPNVFGEDIRRARKRLIAYGWLPRKPAEKESGGEDLVRQGVIEVDGCSGTGYGFCAFDYRHKKGFGLTVTTMGEEYGVTGFDPYCGGSGRNRFGQ